MILYIIPHHNNIIMSYSTFSLQGMTHYDYTNNLFMDHLYKIPQNLFHNILVL